MNFGFNELNKATMKMDRSINLGNQSHWTLVSRRTCGSVQNGIAVTLAMLAFAISGCCTPFGPGCDTGNCYDCDGTNRPIPMGPWQGLKQALTCGGGGCGEVYFGEWISTPPDCPDPCCDDQFVGGAAPCQTGCWTLGSLFAPGRFSGRFAEGRACGTCDSGCDSCDSCGEEYVGEGYFEGEMMEGPIMEQSSGCATCSSRVPPGGMARVKRAPQPGQSTRYAQATQKQDQYSNRAQRIRTATAPSSNRTSNQLRGSMPRSASNQGMNQGMQRMNPSTQQQADEPQSDSMVRYARAEIPQRTPSRTGYAPRTGASRNRLPE